MGEDLLERLRRGDETAFAALVDAHSGWMLRVARAHISSRAVAEEVVQETWIGVIRGLRGFEGRSTLRTWIFRILVNIARGRREAEARAIPFSAFDDPAEPSVDPERFFPVGHPQASRWATPPASWDGLPEERLLSAETLERVQGAIDSLPPGQRVVITMRDVAGASSEEVCDALGISAGNQRVLLHRARSKVRGALERYLDEESTGGAVAQ